MHDRSPFYVYFHFFILLPCDAGQMHQEIKFIIYRKIWISSFMLEFVFYLACGCPNTTWKFIIISSSVWQVLWHVTDKCVSQCLALHSTIAYTKQNYQTLILFHKVSKLTYKVVMLRYKDDADLLVVTLRYKGDADLQVVMLQVSGSWVKAVLWVPEKKHTSEKESMLNATMS